MTAVDDATARIQQAARRQRRIEVLAVVAVLVANLLFQSANRGTVKSAARQSSRREAVIGAQLGGLNDRLAEANARIGQLEESLREAGVPIPEAPPPSPETTVPAQVPGVPRTSTPGATVRPGTSTTASTTAPGPPPTTTTTSPPAQPNPPPTLPGGVPCPTLLHPIPRC